MGFFFDLEKIELPAECQGKAPQTCTIGIILCIISITAKDESLRLSVGPAPQADDYDS